MDVQEAICAIRADVDELKISVRELANIRTRGLEDRAESTKLAITELQADLEEVKIDMEQNTTMTREVHGVVQPFSVHIKDPDKTAKDIIKLTGLADDIERVWGLCTSFREVSLSWCKWFIAVSGAATMIIGALTSHKWYPNLIRGLMDMIT